MKLKLKILTILAIYGLMGCNPNYSKLFEENNQEFEINKSKLKAIISGLEKTYIKNWDRTTYLSIKIDSLNDPTKDNLDELCVGSLEISPNTNCSCDKDYMITLNIIRGWNIRSLRVVQLIYAPCDKRAQEKHHSYDGSNIDIWGQGDNWFIFSDTDFM